MAIRDIYARLDQDYQREAASRRRARALEESKARPEPRGLLTILWDRKLVFLVTLLACLALGIVYIAVTPPRYLATATMLIDPRLGKSVGNDPNTPGFIADTAAMDSQLKLFVSQTVLSRVADKLKLADDPEFNGSKRSLVQRILHPSPPEAGKADLKALEDAITIKRPERTYVVDVEVLAQNAKMAANIANAVTQGYIDDQVGSRVGAARQDSQYVADKLATLSEQIRQADVKIEAYKAKNNIVDANGLRSNEQQVTDLTRSLADARARASEAKARSEQIDRLARQGHGDSSTEALRSQTIERLRAQQAETEQNVARLAQTLGPRHPTFEEAVGRQTKLRKLIRDELRRLKLAANADYRAAKRNEGQINAEVDKLKGQSTEQSRSLVPLDQLERDRKVLRSNFDRFAQVNDNLAQQEAESPPGRVIAIARPAVSPARPKKTIVGLISISAGVFFGLAAALFAESTGPRRPLIPAVVYDTPREAPRPAPPSRQDASARPQPTRRYWDDDDDARA